MTFIEECVLAPFPLSPSFYITLGKRRKNMRNIKQKKKWRQALVLAVFILCVPVMGADMEGEKASNDKISQIEASDSTQKKTKKEGLKKEGKYYYYYKKGKKVKKKWVNIGKHRYFFNEKGRAATYSMAYKGAVYVFGKDGRLKQPKSPRVVTVGERKYYVDAKGKAQVGWFTAKGRLYYGDKKGRLYQNGKTREGVSFTDKGYAVEDTASRLKIRTMEIISQITTPDMTNAQKLLCAWNYVVSNMRYSMYYPSWRTGWQQELSLIALTQGRGNCYGYACAFSALAREIGYDPYLVCGRVSGTRDGARDGMTRHCWVLLGGTYYDPEAHALGWYRGVYGKSYYGVPHTVQSYVRFAM